MRRDGGRFTRLAAPFGKSLVVALALATTVGLPWQSRAGSPQEKGTRTGPSRDGRRSANKTKSKYGVLVNSPKAFQGYTLFAPTNTTKTYLIDMQGRVVHVWKSEYDPSSGAYLLENGHLVRGGHIDNTPLGTGPGRGGRVQEFTWDGELVWDYKCADGKQFSHHDLCKLPNGNVLLIVRQKKTSGEIAEAGGKMVGPIIVDSILEVRPTGKTTGTVVWEWNFWDHLVQDADKTKANYGDPAAHPERIDLNTRGREDFFGTLAKSSKDLDKLRSLGYLGSSKKSGAHMSRDWTHINSVAYNAELDQVMLSVHSYSEIWVIDHSTTKAEAAGHSGGRYGKGGDLLYRWGNPRTYRAGTTKDRQLFNQHDAYWIPRGLPGAGHAMVFNNGTQRSDGHYSSEDEIVLPVDKQGHYRLKTGTAYGPERPVWSYTAPNKSDFFSRIMGGGCRLPNGNTLICASTTATFFEVTPDGEVVWKFVTPPPQAGVRSGHGKLDFELSAEKVKEVQRLQKEVDAKVEQVFTAEQKEQLKKAQQSNKDLPPVAHLMVPFMQSNIKLAAEQKRQLAQFKREITGKLDHILTREQKTQLQKMLHSAMRTGGKGRPGSAGQKGNPRRADLTIGAAFRAYRYAPSYPGLIGRDLTPGRTVEELEADETKATGSR